MKHMWGQASGSYELALACVSIQLPRPLPG
jgi:hypothetical protein